MREILHRILQSVGGVTVCGPLGAGDHVIDLRVVGTLGNNPAYRMPQLTVVTLKQ
ncbi:MAG: hypothetical protein U1F48_09725 [Burkholderiales bacterium]